MSTHDDAPLVVRPRTLTRVCWASAVLVTAVFALVGWGLTRSEGDAGFGTADAIAMTGLGALLGAAALSFTRARVVAGADGVRVRNVGGETGVPWAVVRSVRFDEGASWASLELQDDDTLPLLAVQANDGAYAREAVAQLRLLLERSRAA
ncbi:MAG TPA: PH domain-containing protein [Mycobacteriales bacterium]|nr:PH domain-containing protein [Mycobacteriales bacterium]